MANNGYFSVRYIDGYIKRVPHTPVPDGSLLLSIPNAPRYVSWKAVLSVLYSGRFLIAVLALVDWATLCLLLIVSVFGINIQNIARDIGRWIPTENRAELLSSISTGTSIGGNEVYRHSFRWTNKDGVPMQGVCYSYCKLTENRPQLERLVNNADIVRIESTYLSQGKTLNHIAMICFLLVPLVLLILFLFWKIPKTIKYCQLLRHGIPTIATLEKIEGAIPPGQRTPSTPRLHFKYQDNTGHGYNTIVKTRDWRQFTHCSHVVMFYDPCCPLQTFFPDTVHGLLPVPNVGYDTTISSLMLPLVLSCILITELSIIFIYVF